MARLRDLPLFPLGIVLLPGEVVPLHIFEPRYREMVARCIDGPEPFCVVLADDEGDMRDVGCLARDIEVLERMDDGRLNIAVTGGEPVEIDTVDAEAHPYLVAEARMLDDDEAARPDEPAVEAALAAYRELVETVSGGEEGPPEPEPGPRLSYAIAGRIDFGTDVKQALKQAAARRKAVA